MTTMIPVADTIPTSWGYFQFFLLLTFPLHLLLMNAVLGTTVLGIHAHWQGEKKSLALAGELAKVLPLLIALTVNFGVAPLLFLQVLYGQFIYVSSVLIGTFWILVIPTLLSCYYAAYWYDFKFAKLGRPGIVVLTLVGVGLLGIGFLFSNNMTLMLHPDVWDAYFDHSGGTLLNLGDVALWPRYLHFIVGGTAIGGLAVAFYGRFLARRDRELGELAMARGMRLFSILTVVQVAVGVWFLLALPRQQMLLFMGQNALATASFTIALLLVAVVLFLGFRKKLFATAGVAVVLLYLMAFMRDFLRGGYLQDYFSPQMLTVVPQYSPLLFFLGTLVVGLCLVGWMLRVAFTRGMN